MITNIIRFFTIFFLISFALPAQQQTISTRLYQLSPLAEIIARNLDLQDRNGNGVIDRGVDEGYEGFTAKYGNADTGFPANHVIYGADNGKLEEYDCRSLY
jgi:hypothetical protein